MSRLKLDQTQALFKRAQAVMPWRVSSNFRCWGEDETPVIARGGATEYLGVKGDLITCAKSLANGCPLAAIGGSQAVMDTIEPGLMAPTAATWSAPRPPRPRSTSSSTPMPWRRSMPAAPA